MRIEDAREEVATEDTRIACTTEELTQLMVKSAEVFEPIEVALGTGKLIWPAGAKALWYIIELGRMRGVFDENKGGDGI